MRDVLLVTVDALKNALTPDQKELLIEKITAALVEVGGENTRPLAWVRINEFESGDWAVGGQRLSAHDVIEMTRGNHPRSFTQSKKPRNAGLCQAKND